MFPILKSLKTNQERHDYILKTLALNKNFNREHQKQKRDIDVIREHHRFLWNDDDAEDNKLKETWETRLARRYYDKLFKEYCIADLTRYKENKVALRWRTESEVVTGKGQFICGSKQCEERDDLSSWEVNFAYQEHGEKKNALIKLRLCQTHSTQLNYSSRKREMKRLKQNERAKAKESKRHARKSDLNRELQGQSDLNEIDVEDIHFEDEDHRSTINIPTEETVKEKNKTETNGTEQIWNQRTEIESETHNRENEFERYIENLLL